jgi:hypothetical protein
MLISDYANLPENKSGFWIEKLYSENNQCSFLVFYEGYSSFNNSISEAKKNLTEHHLNVQAKHQSIVASCRKSLRRKAVYEWLKNLDENQLYIRH